MIFDWVKFLKQHNVDYKTTGPSTARGNVYVACPMCARAEDIHRGSYRMGISTSGKGWACWRNTDHRGIRPHHLVQALLKCSYTEAATIVGDSVDALPPVGDRSFGDYVKTMLAPPPAREPPRKLDFTADMKPAPLHQFFLRYLVERGYPPVEAVAAAEDYQLRYALHGVFRYRIIFPVYEGGKLLCWTGRSISARAGLRYRSLSADAEKAKKDNLPRAVRSIDRCLWNYDRLAHEGGHTLAVCEGPFDAMRLDFYGQSYGLRATCLFTKAVSEGQIELLDKLAPNFKRRLLILDRGTALESIGTVGRLSFLGFTVWHVPQGVKDPALMTPHAVRDLAKGSRR